MRKLVALGVWLCLAVASTGCVHTDFEPTRGAPRGDQPELTTRCVLAENPQLELLVQVGGVVLGTLEVEGAPAASFAKVHDNAREDAAELGASHVVVVKTWTDAPARIANMKKVQVDESKEGPKCGRYLVVRVKAERWGELPEGLRPVPLERWKKVVAASIATHRGQPAQKPTAVMAVAAVPATVEPRGPAPTGALGFVFGGAASELGSYCASLPGTFSQVNAERASCAGSFEAGIDARASSVDLTLCGGRLCQVTVNFAPAASGAAEAIQQRLLEKNGPATTAGEGTWSWLWSTGGAVRLLASADSAHVTYSSADGVRQERAQGL